jgi:hypothetical protein
VTARDALARLFSCFDATYQVLGSSAPQLTNDAYVVRTYEAARAIGGVTLSLREVLGAVESQPVAALHDVLLESVAEDLTGALLLYCLAMVVGPRLLVSLRDAREFEEFPGDALEVVTRASGTLLAEILAVGEVAKRQGPIDDPHWQERARGLSEQLDQAGFADSFGVSR